MIAYAQTLGEDRRGFLLVNGFPGYLVVHESQESEFKRLRAEGWKIISIRPITTSMEVKVLGLPPEILDQKVFAYSLCLLERPRVTQAVAV
ncbi:MAG: hypothetical protein EA425_18445 [Puniceicoccaceae bacterium]|nr:MAG: hypothetical protein EA425_18445 [Puniceicoccaceae bacterium]